MVRPMEPTVSVAEAATYLGISPNGVHQRIKRGQLQAEKIGKHVRVYLPSTIIEQQSTDLTTLEPEDVNDRPAQSVNSVTNVSPAQWIAMGDYNSRTIAPLVGRIAEMEAQVRSLSSENGDLRRQVRQLKATVAGLQAVIARAMNKTCDDGD